MPAGRFMGYITLHRSRSRTLFVCSAWRSCYVVPPNRRKTPSPSTRAVPALSRFGTTQLTRRLATFLGNPLADSRVSVTNMEESGRLRVSCVYILKTWRASAGLSPALNAPHLLLTPLKFQAADSHAYIPDIGSFLARVSCVSMDVARIGRAITRPQRAPSVSLLYQRYRYFENQQHILPGAQNVH